MDNQDIIHRINLLLNEKGISKQDFYNECGISSAAFSQWNTGKTSPKAKSLNKIASYLDTTVEYLISGTKQKKPAAETGDEPKAEINERLHTIRIAGRDGSYEERQLTDEQMDLLRQMIRQMPKPQDGDL